MSSFAPLADSTEAIRLCQFAIWRRRVRFCRKHHGRCGASLDVELLVDMLKMLLNRSRAESKKVGDLWICLAFCYQDKHLAFAAGQRGQPLHWRGPQSPLGGLGSLQQAGPHLRDLEGLQQMRPGQAQYRAIAFGEIGALSIDGNADEKLGADAEAHGHLVIYGQL